MHSERKIAVLFPGQGSQYVGMGREFLEAEPAAAELMELAESVSGFPLRRLCLEGPLDQLTRTMNLQPAITVINLICWQMVAAAGIRPDCFAGHSLGEYSALCAAEILTPRDTLALVTERGRLMEREGERHPGGMHAVLGLSLQDVEQLIEAAADQGIITVANHNSRNQIVVSGEEAALEKLASLAAAEGGKAISLPVSAANHSPLVAGAVPDFEEFMSAVAFQPPAAPVFFNVTASPEADPAIIRNIMASQIASRVRWLEIINTLLEQGVSVFIEVGPKKVLSGLLRKIVPRERECRIFQIDTPATLEACLKGLS